MAESSDVNALGKKIFFLYPSAITQNQIIPELAQEEFEVYSVKDEEKLRKLLGKYSDSIVFANINEGMKESAWEEWIRGIMFSPDTSSVSIGIITSGAIEFLRRKYVEQLKVACGYTVIKSDISGVLRQLIAILNSVNAKGRRKYIRVLTGNESNVTVNLPMNGTYVNGVIRDISVVGFSCSFKDDPGLIKNKLFPDIQIRLHTQLLKAEGIIFGSRMEGNEKVYVILLTQHVDPGAKAKIRKFIQSNLQGKIESEMK